MTKRVVDVLVVLLTSPLWIPVGGLVALLVRWRLGGPVFFRQVRPGLHGTPFTLVKFRTLSDARGTDGELLPDGMRMTSFGRWLRSTSLDEIPEVWNVLRGEMSLVGPRPLLLEYLALYSPAEARRHVVRPGMTGWAQVNGRNAITWPDRFLLDLWYVDHHSLWLDMKILVLTGMRVLQRRGISQPNDPTMPRFTGHAG